MATTERPHAPQGELPASRTDSSPLSGISAVGERRRPDRCVVPRPVPARDRQGCSTGRRPRCPAGGSGDARLRRSLACATHSCSAWFTCTAIDHGGPGRGPTETTRPYRPIRRPPGAHVLVGSQFRRMVPSGRTRRCKHVQRTVPTNRPDSTCSGPAVAAATLADSRREWFA